MTFPFTPDTWIDDIEEYATLVTVPVRLLAPPEALIAAATTPNAWEPACLRDAISALVLRKNPQVAMGCFHAPHFPLDLAFVTKDPQTLKKRLAHHPLIPTQGWPVLLLATILDPELSGQKLGLSAFFPERHPTAHDQLADHARATAVWQHTCATID